MYQPRHSQHRRRSRFLGLSLIHRRWHVTSAVATFAHPYAEVDLFTAAGWLSKWPPLKPLLLNAQFAREFAG